MTKRPEDLFREHGGQLRMSEAIRLGMSRYMLYKLLDYGVIERVSRGIYRLVQLPPIGNPDLVTVGLRIPNGVVCLVSALAFHGMTTQIPHEVSVAVPRGSRAPRGRTSGSSWRTRSSSGIACWSARTNSSSTAAIRN